MKSTFALLIVILFHFTAFSQEQSYYLTHHHPQDYGHDNFSFDLTCDEFGMISIANRYGVLKYDGHAWEFHQTPSASLSLAIGANNVTYVGCVNTFGKLDYDENAYEFISLSDNDSLNILYTQTITFGQYVYFLSHKLIQVYDTKNEELLDPIISNDDSGFNLLFAYNQKLFINTTDGAIAELSANSIGETILFTPDKSSLAFFKQNESTGRVIAGLMDGAVYDFDGSQFIEYTQCNDLLNEDHYIIDGTWVNENIFALGTLQHGVFLFNSDQEDFFEVVDFNTGLPDNEVFAVSTDISNGLWLSHEFGLTRLAMDLPIKSMLPYPGIKGHITAFEFSGKKQYMGTSTGLYYLNAIQHYERQVYYETVYQTQAPPAPVKETQKPAVQEEEEPQKKGFLKGLFKKKKDQEKPESKPEQKKNLFKRLSSWVNETKSNIVSKVKGKPQQQYVKKVRKIPGEVTYVYENVDGISSKCEQLIPYQNGLLAITNTGIFEVNNNTADQIITDPIRNVVVMNDRKEICYSTYNHSIYIYRQYDDIWSEVQIIDELDDAVVSMYFDSKTESLWVCGITHLHQFAIENDVYKRINSFPIKNVHFDQPLIYPIRDSIYLISRNGYYKVDGQELKPVTAFAENPGLPRRMLKDNEGIAWIYNGKFWIKLDHEGQTFKYEYMGLFPHLDFLYKDPDENEYIIKAEDNLLYTFQVSDDNIKIPANQLHIKRVLIKNGLIRPSQKLQFSYDQDLLSFELAQPDYLGLLDVVYQYKLDGFMKEWSEWSTENKITLNFLAPGEYKIHIRSKDAFNRIQDSEVIAFEITPPYWQKPWFYALELILFSGLLFISARLNRQNSRYKLLTSGLTLLTLVLVIEFVQSVIENTIGAFSSPVIDFMINVIAALLVLPLERVLRIVITNNQEQGQTIVKNIKGFYDKKLSKNNTEE